MSSTSPTEVSTSNESFFPGWGLYVPRLIHPLKVAAVEALHWIDQPLSAALVAKLFSGGGDGFGESNVRYHLNHLVQVGLLEVVPSIPASSGGPKEKFFFFSGSTTDF